MRMKTEWKRNLPAAIACFSMDPRGNFIACAQVDGAVTLYSSDNKVIWEGALGVQPLAITCGVNGQNVGLIGASGEVIVIDNKGLSALKKRVEFSANALAFRPESSAMVLGNRYRLLRLARRDGAILKRGELKHPVDYISYSPGGTYLCAADSMGNCTIMRSNLDEVKQLQLSASILGVSLSKGMHSLALFTADQGIAIVDTDSLNAVFLQGEDEYISVDGNASQDRFFCLRKNGSLILIDNKTETVMGLPVGDGCQAVAVCGSGRSAAAFLRPDLSTSQLVWFTVDEKHEQEQIRRPQPEQRSSRQGRAGGGVIDYVELD